MSFARRSRVGNAISTCMAKARVTTHSTIACVACYVYSLSSTVWSTSREGLVYNDTMI